MNMQKQKLLDVTSKTELMTSVEEMEFITYPEDGETVCGHRTFLHNPSESTETCVECCETHQY